MNIKSFHHRAETCFCVQFRRIRKSIRFLFKAFLICLDFVLFLTPSRKIQIFFFPHVRTLPLITVRKRLGVLEYIHRDENSLWHLELLTDEFLFIAVPAWDRIIDVYRWILSECCRRSRPHIFCHPLGAVLSLECRCGDVLVLILVLSITPSSVFDYKIEL